MPQYKVWPDGINLGLGFITTDNTKLDRFMLSPPSLHMVCILTVGLLWLMSTL